MEKQKKIEYLLKRMETEPMSRHDMAHAINMSVVSTCKYITELKFYKKIYIYEYKKTGSSYSVYYKTGNLPDADKIKALSQAEYNKRYRLKHREPIRRPTKIIPRPDYAAAWLYNPINE
jgi:hypothetical protein